MMLDPEYNPEDIDPEEIFEQVEESYERGEGEEEIYGKEPLFLHREGYEEDIENVKEYLEDEDLDEFSGLYEEDFEEVIEDLDRAPEDFDYDENYVSIDEDNELLIEYEVEEDRDSGYDIEVRIHDMPEGLFGFTKMDGVVHINKNLYKFEKESTIAHEMHHHLNPAHDEFTVRHLNGDIDPGNLPSTRRNRHPGGKRNAPSVQAGLQKQYPARSKNQEYRNTRKIA